MTSISSNPVCAICGAVENGYNLNRVGTRYICDTCASDYNASSYIHSYGFKPAADFRGYGRNKRYFGVELEVVPASHGTYARQLAIGSVVTRLKDLVYLKRDGSLPSDGFEIVSHPFSLGIMFDKSIFSKLAECPLKSFTEPSTGLHVHVSRTGLKGIQLAKLVYFFSLPENDSFLKYIAQRDFNHYCMKNQGSFKQEYTKNVPGVPVWESRYRAVNFCNAATIEFRMFKGNVKPSAVYRAVEFVDAMLEFCRSTSAAKMNYKEFISYVNNMPGKRHEHLKCYINDFAG